MASYQDSGRSVLVAVACSWCLFWTMIVNRSGGIVFVTMISEMGASRQAASWPFSLLGAVSNIFGVVSGILLRKLPLRAVSIAGSLLVASGILLSVAFYGVIGITLSIGIITAVGQGLIFPSNMVAINTYFNKYRATGSGISYVGGTLVSFIFPSLLVHMHEQYGLRGTLLIVGGLTLNAAAGSLLVAKPDEALIRRSPRRQPERENGDKLLNQAGRTEGRGGDELSFLRRPIYYVIVFTGVVFAYNLVMFSVTVVDHGMGRGLSKLQAALLLSCYGAGEFVGRISSGIISDKKLCHRRDIMAVGFLLASFSLLALIHGDSLVLLGAASVLFGLTGGCIMILFSVLMVEYFGLKKLPMAIGIHCLVNGLSALPRPLLIGYYRDRGSSYAGMYLLLALVSLATSLLWAIECFVKWRAQKATAHVIQKAAPVNEMAASEA
ncbi:monocarboxylate transporter 12-like [Dermacentor andersoni]|uniref:monocarboxylate transporter 12-like n=1 Tax=Dermacentor andersoni TaxID=34620 RepID=UPI002155B57C|nr:monocarboxylate transporter 12-like [Dermacentor andersoni]